MRRSPPRCAISSRAARPSRSARAASSAWCATTRSSSSTSRKIGVRALFPATRSSGNRALTPIFLLPPIFPSEQARDAPVFDLGHFQLPAVPGRPVSFTRQAAEQREHHSRRGVELAARQGAEPFLQLVGRRRAVDGERPVG